MRSTRAGQGLGARTAFEAIRDTSAAHTANRRCRELIPSVQAPRTSVRRTLSRAIPEEGKFNPYRDQNVLNSESDASDTTFAKGEGGVRTGQYADAESRRKED
ncbi:hypothetical protein NDU88_004104 [Pleurodeles waltl]|uniref:Uncharacterized protein n=1 Tax=Pleurodeles waltl TaxID=8319 RepID=A0AAV7KZC9_PLEWA|nr:hypothetical protein NDU88_004104 [Pleurodeles waltl]